MNVKQLKKAIALLPDDMEVYLQTDPEGNGYYPLRCSDSDAIATSNEDGYRPEEVYSLDWTAEDCCLSEEEWAEIKRENPRALILAP